MELNGKIAVVTGASRGLGAAFAEMLAREGVVVVICSRRAEDIAAECEKLTSAGGRCEGYAVDVTVRGQVRQFIDRIVAKHGRIDVLVNNAGVVHSLNQLEDVPVEEYRDCMAANVDGVFHFLQAVVPVMRRQGSGVIVNVSSGAGKRGHAGVSAYSASKFAVQGLTQSLAQELEGTGVQCIALCPGGVNTVMRVKVCGEDDAARQQSPEAVAAVLRDVLLERIRVPSGGDVSIRDGKVAAVHDGLQ